MKNQKRSKRNLIILGVLFFATLVSIGFMSTSGSSDSFRKQYSDKQPIELLSHILSGSGSNIDYRISKSQVDNSICGNSYFLIRNNNNQVITIKATSNFYKLKASDLIDSDMGEQVSVIQKGIPLYEFSRSSDFYAASPHCGGQNTELGYDTSCTFINDEIVISPNEVMVLTTDCNLYDRVDFDSHMFDTGFILIDRIIPIGADIDVEYRKV